MDTASHDRCSEYLIDVHPSFISMAEHGHACFVRFRSLPSEGARRTELRSQFDDQLRHVKIDVVRLAALVGETIPRSTEALIARDRVALDALRAADSDIDRLAAAIEAEGCRLLALQQPVASDLRALVTALRMAYELERIGDLMVDAVSTIDGPFHEIDARTRGQVEQLGELIHALLQASIDAYVDGDAHADGRLSQVLSEVIDVHHRLVDHLLLTAREGGIDVDAAVQFALVGRCYERAAEHAFTIVRRVRYLVAGARPSPDTEIDDPPSPRR